MLDELSPKSRFNSQSSISEDMSAEAMPGCFNRSAGYIYYLHARCVNAVLPTYLFTYLVGFGLSGLGFFEWESFIG